MLRAQWKAYRLNFKFEARTSRASMLFKDTYFVKVWDDENTNLYGIGECALFKGLSAEDNANYENILSEWCLNPSNALPNVSSIRFGLETAIADLNNGGKGIIAPNSNWIKGNNGIAINGLIWMGDKDLMLHRINEKLNDGFKCLKMKIGGINFDDEVELLHYIREHFPSDKLEIRLDANGSFSPDNALKRLETLSRFDIHSLEQPIKAGQIKEMSHICKNSSIAIALDEELIGDTNANEKYSLLNEIRPQYIILKPALCGGLSGADDWIHAANKLNIGWWATSALESNIGLNAIAQWISTKNTDMRQGLGTGELYHNNFDSPIYRQGEQLFFNPNKSRAEVSFE